jgi:transcription antitermination factor NusB
MSHGAGALTIPARISASQLAEFIERPLGEVTAVLAARGEPAGDDEAMGAELAIAIAATLGVTVQVEPRDMALECLYELDTRGEIGGEVGGRAGLIVDGVLRDLDDLDQMIESVSEHWSVARMPVIDRNILRIGLYELRAEPTTPTAVVVSEAVRLAQTYSTEKSSSFVNGVLSALAKTLRAG